MNLSTLLDNQWVEPYSSDTYVSHMTYLLLYSSLNNVWQSTEIHWICLSVAYFRYESPNDDQRGQIYWNVPGFFFSAVSWNKEHPILILCMLQFGERQCILIRLPQTIPRSLLNLNSNTVHNVSITLTKAPLSNMVSNVTAVKQRAERGSHTAATMSRFIISPTTRRPEDLLLGRCGGSYCK